MGQFDTIALIANQKKENEVEKAQRHDPRQRTKEEELEKRWESIPIGKENAVGYGELCYAWKKDERQVRAILHELSLYDAGDGLVLIRSAKSRGGFYRTADPEDMKAYRKECLNKGKSIFAPVRKINAILKAEEGALQCGITNNTRSARAAAGLSLKEAADMMRERFRDFDTAALWRIEEGTSLPTPAQLGALAAIYGTKTSDLLTMSDEALGAYTA